MYYTQKNLILSLMTSFFTVTAHGAVLNFDSSTDKIVDLVRTDTLESIFAPSSPSYMTKVIKNYSPALIAFEAEVFNASTPVIVYIFNESDPEQEATYTLVQLLAQRHAGEVKVVAMNADTYFSLIEAFNIPATPSFIIFKKRDIIEKISGNDSIVQLTSIIHTIVADKQKDQ